MTSGTLVTLAPAPAAPDALAATARDCQAVGATVVVLPPSDPGAAREAVAALREETDLLVQAADPALGAPAAVVNASGTGFGDPDVFIVRGESAFERAAHAA